MKPLSEILDCLGRSPLQILKNFPLNGRDQFLSYCRAAFPQEQDPFLHWDFGPVMELKVSEESPNYLFSRENVPFHWDGVFHQVPSVLVFHCLVAPPANCGGETTFCDAERLYTHIPHPLKRRWENARVTYRTARLAHYGGEATFPLFGVHPHKGTRVVRFAERVQTEKNPVEVSFAGVSASVANDIYQYFSEALYDPFFCTTHQWETGDLLIADNHALLHGRKAFARHSARHIRRVQLRDLGRITA